MDSRPLAEDGVQIGVGQHRGVERPDPLADRHRSREGLLHRHLLIEQEPDQQRHRLLDEQLVRGVVVSEIQTIGHMQIVSAAWRSAKTARRSPTPCSP